MYESGSTMFVYPTIKQIKTDMTTCSTGAKISGVTVDAVQAGEKSTGTLAHGGSSPMKRKLYCLH